MHRSGHGSEGPSSGLDSDAAASILTSEYSELSGSVNRSDQSYRARAAFFTLVAGMSMISGFAATLMAAKRKDSAMFDKGLVGNGMSETGSALAMRALGRGTLYAVGGFSVFCFAVWKLTGATSMDDLTAKIQSTMRAITPKDDRPRGRSEFSSVRELVNYILDEDAKAAGRKSSERK